MEKSCFSCTTAQRRPNWTPSPTSSASPTSTATSRTIRRTVRTDTPNCLAIARAVTCARTNSWTAWRSNILSILLAPPVNGIRDPGEASMKLGGPQRVTEFRETG